MQTTKPLQPQSPGAGKKRPANAIESGTDMNASPECDAAAEDIHIRKRAKFQEELVGAQKSLASGKIVRQGLANSLTTKSKVIIDLQDESNTQKVELKRRHAQIMELLEKQETLILEAEEVRTENERLTKELESARDEIEDVKKTANDTAEVAALRKTIEDTKSDAIAAMAAATAETNKQALGFSGRLKKRDDRIKQLEAELRRHDVEVPKPAVPIGRPK